MSKAEGRTNTEDMHTFTGSTGTHIVFHIHLRLYCKQVFIISISFVNDCQGLGDSNS